MHGPLSRCPTSHLVLVPRQPLLGRRRLQIPYDDARVARASGQDTLGRRCAGTWRQTRHRCHIVSVTYLDWARTVATGGSGQARRQAHRQVGRTVAATVLQQRRGLTSVDATSKLPESLKVHSLAVLSREAVSRLVSSIGQSARTCK